MKHVEAGESSKIAGVLTIQKFKDGKLVERIERIPNRVVMSDGYGRNLLVRRLAGDGTYPIEIDSASVGDSSTAAADGQTDLVSSLVDDIPITNRTAVDDVLTVDVFVADGNLPDDTYAEFGLFCDGRLFSRIVISPGYTKATGEDTLFTYELTLSS